MQKIIFILIFIPFYSFADLDGPSSEALEKTQDLMNDPTQRDAAIGKDDAAKQMDSKLEDFAGKGKNKDELYKLSSGVLGNLANQNKGDADAMKKIIEQAEKNPEAFYKEYLSEDQKKAVRDLANEIQKDKPVPANKPN